MSYNKIATMEYLSNLYGEYIRYYEIYKGYEFIIDSYAWPCAYIFLKENDPFTKGNDTLDVDFINIPVHGGCTYYSFIDQFLRFKNYKPLLRSLRVIGWDYAHSGDYIGGTTPKGKMWSLKEIQKDAYSAIDLLLEYNNKKMNYYH